MANCIESATASEPKYCLVERELIGHAERNMIEIISDVKAAEKPGNFKQLEFCYRKEDAKRNDLVLLRAVLKD